jgi:hypothetical protein
MKRVYLIRRLLAPAAVFWALHPQGLFACAACFGKSDSPMARGMNMGIFSLLAVVVTVLSGVAGFFIYLARRSAQAAKASAPVEWRETVSQL